MDGDDMESRKNLLMPQMRSDPALEGSGSWPESDEFLRRHSEHAGELHIVLGGALISEIAFEVEEGVLSLISDVPHLIEGVGTPFEHAPPKKGIPAALVGSGNDANSVLVVEVLFLGHDYLSSVVIQLLILLYQKRLTPVLSAKKSTPEWIRTTVV